MPLSRPPRWTAWPLAIFSVGLMLSALLLAWIDQVVLVPRSWTDAMRASQTMGSFRGDLVRTTLTHVIARLPASPDNAPARAERLHQALTKESLIFASQVFPDAWLMDEVERIASTSLHNLRSSDPFYLRISLASRSDIAAQTLHDHLHHSYAFHALYSQLLQLTIHLFAKHNPTLPFGIQADARTLHMHALRVAPSGWVGRQVAAASQSLADYMQGRTPHVEVFLPLHERTSQLKRSLAALLATADLRRFLRQRIVRPLVTTHVGERLDIRWGLSLSASQLIAAFDLALTDAWLETTREHVTEAATTYLLDASAPLDVRIPVEPLFEAVAEQTSKTILEALHRLLRGLPPCPNLTTFRAQLTRATPPACQPTGMAAVAIEVWIRHTVRVRTLAELRTHVPTSWTYDETQMRARVSDNTWQTIQTIRIAMTQGLTINEVSLTETLPRHLQPTVQQALSILREGLILSEAELLPDLPAEQRTLYSSVRTFLQALQPTWIICLLLGVLCAIAAVTLWSDHLLTRLRLTAWWLFVISVGMSLWGLLTHSVLASAFDRLRAELPILNRPVYDDLTPQLVRHWMAPWWMLSLALLTLALLGLAATLSRWYKKPG